MIAIERLGLICFALLGLHSYARGSESGAYFGASYGEADFEASNNWTVKNESNDVWMIAAGYRFSPYFRAELGYGDFGGYEDSRPSQATAEPMTDVVRFSFKGTLMSLTGTLPLGKFELEAKAGVVFTDVEVEMNVHSPSIARGLSNVESTRSDAFQYGVGAGYEFFDHLLAKVNWTKLSAIEGGERGPKTSIDVVSLGIDYRF